MAVILRRPIGPGDADVSVSTVAGYMAGHASGLPLQQQLEHASQKSGFVEDKYKMQQPALRGMAGMTPQQQQALIPQTVHVAQQAQSKVGACQQP